MESRPESGKAFPLVPLGLELAVLLLLDESQDFEGVEAHEDEAVIEEVCLRAVHLEQLRLALLGCDRVAVLRIWLRKNIQGLQVVIHQLLEKVAGDVLVKQRTHCRRVGRQFGGRLLLNSRDLGLDLGFLNEAVENLLHKQLVHLLVVVCHLFAHFICL